MNTNKRNKMHKAVVGLERLDDRVVPTPLMLGPGGMIGPFFPGNTGFVGPVTPSMGILHNPFATSQFLASLHMPNPGPGGLFGPFIPGQPEVTGPVNPTMGILHTGLHFGGTQFSFFAAHQFGANGFPFAQPAQPGHHIPGHTVHFSFFAVPTAFMHSLLV